MKNLFIDEIMCCEKCKRKQKANPKVESMWTIVQVDNKLLYYCPQCWGVPEHLIPPESKVKK